MREEDQMATDTRCGSPRTKVFALLSIATAGVALAFACLAPVNAQPQPTPQPAQPIDPDIAEAIELTDTEAELRIEARLYEELGITDPSAQVNDGVATLRGTVDSEDERLRAAAIARNVEGVGQVIDELEVDATAIDDPPVGNTGGTLETAVVSELQRDPLLGSRDIRVVADRRTNTVTLIGEVRSQAERQHATRVAQDAFAAGQVRNRLQVRQ
jgi:osmotically-inducible protein OsmY